MSHFPPSDTAAFNNGPLHSSGIVLIFRSRLEKLLCFVCKSESSNVATLVVLALPLATGEDFFGSQVPDALEGAALAELATHAFVDTVLDGVYILVACDFGLVQVVCRSETVSQRWCFRRTPVERMESRSMWEGEECTLCNVAGLVITPPAEDLVFDPRHPALVLPVVPVLCAFHDVYRFEMKSSDNGGGHGGLAVSQSSRTEKWKQSLDDRLGEEHRSEG